MPFKSTLKKVTQTAPLTKAEELHKYWFSDLSSSKEYLEERLKIWFYKNPAIDEYIKGHFAKWLTDTSLSQQPEWQKDSQAYVSLIILFDQIPRNSFRGSPQSFQYDPIALDLCLQGLGTHDLKLHPLERMFFYLPMEHSEDIKIQQKSVEQFQNLHREFVGSPFEGVLDQNVDYAVRHFEIIKRFGRFPHRNQVLGRTSTPEEIAFLKEPNSSF